MKKFILFIILLVLYINTFSQTLTTGIADPIGLTTATLNGVINPEGSSYYVGFEYGTNRSDLDGFADATWADGSSDVDKAVDIESLSVNTTYYFSIVTHAFGSIQKSGDTVSFTTDNYSAPTLTTKSASSITKTSASSGGDITNDGGGTVSDRGVYYGTSASPSTTGTDQSGGSGIDFETSITGLTAGTLYYIQSYATNE